MNQAGTRSHPAYLLYRIAWQGVDYLFPPECGGCGTVGTRWCGDCANGVDLIQDSFCPKCGELETDGLLCRRCQENLPAYHALRSWAVFRGPLREALHRLKYKQDIGLGDVFAEKMSALVRRNQWPVDLVMPVPLSQQRAAERGYNQAGLLSLPLALALRLPHKPGAVKRIRDTVSQVGLTAQERKENVSGAFRAESSLVEKKTVLLVDDVATTGSTLNACASAMLAGGARAVYCITLARAATQKRTEGRSVDNGNLQDV